MNTVDVGPCNCNIIDHRRDMIELAFNEGVSTNITTELESYQYQSGDILLCMPDCRYVITPDKEARMFINSIAVEIPGLDFRRHEMSPEEASLLLEDSDNDTFFISQVTPTDESEHILYSSLFKTVINHYGAGSASERMMALSGWFELTALLDTRFRELVRGHSLRYNSGAYYIYKAKQYICAHLGERLTLLKIAEELGISSTYLCTCFRKGTGQTVVDFINKLRCQQIRAQIANTDSGFAEICAAVGLHDRRHAQRLFKKYYGVSMQRCRQLDKGVSLYHENPWKRDFLDHDIFGDSMQFSSNQKDTE